MTDFNRWIDKLNFSGASRALAVINRIPCDVFLGAYDFSYAPYALGDALTWQEKILVEAIDNGYDKVRLCLVTDPLRPSCHLQPHINTSNYTQIIQNLYPALLSNPLLESVHVYQDRNSFSVFLFDSWNRGVSSWPSYDDHFACDLDFISHKEINAYYEKHDNLPRLAAPRGYTDAADDFLAACGEKRFLVTVNIRMSQMSLVPADVHRDSPVQEWHTFFRKVAKKYPDVLFLYAGGYGEWDADMMKHSNVIILRGAGLDLGHELAILHHSDLFMGTSSGFAAAATFSEVPYLITNMEHRFSQFNGIPVGAARYPFGLNHQYIHWERETEQYLMERFEEIYHATRDDVRSTQALRHRSRPVPSSARQKTGQPVS